MSWFLIFIEERERASLFHFLFKKIGQSFLCASFRWLASRDRQDILVPQSDPMLRRKAFLRLPPTYKHRNDPTARIKT